MRERHSLGNGSDIGRMKRQQAFIASMAHQAISANTLANPIHLAKFIDAATKSLTLDPDIGSISKLVGLAYQFRHIGLDNIQFVTTPWEPDPSDPNRVVWAPEAQTLWNAIDNDEVLPKAMLNGLAQRPAHPRRDQAPEERSAGAGPGRGQPRQRPLRLSAEQPDDRRPHAGRAGASGRTDEPEWQRRRRLAAVFGDVLPDTTRTSATPRRADPRRTTRATGGCAARCRPTTAERGRAGRARRVVGRRRQVVGVAGSRCCRRSATRAGRGSPAGA